VFDKDFLSFKKLVMPTIIQRLFWVGVIFAFVFGIAIMVDARNREGWETAGQIAVGFGVILVFALLTRVFCEVMVVMFRINETLTELRRDMSNLRPQASPHQKICGKCGVESPATARFCPECGQPL
jgi:hypothetical protein